MSKIEKWLLRAALAAWIGLGCAHVAIVMLGPEGWRPDRSAPGAGAVIGHPHDTDPRAVAGPLALAAAADAPRGPLQLSLPEATDSADLLYIRYQLTHLLYPRRVHVQRIAGEQPPTPGDSALVVLAPGVTPPATCRAVGTAHDYVRVECGLR